MGSALSRALPARFFSGSQAACLATNAAIYNPAIAGCGNIRLAFF
jgi:hypothetical protein